MKAGVAGAWRYDYSMVEINQEWLTENPHWSDFMTEWKAREDARWEDADEYRGRGFTFDQTAAALGVEPEPGIEEVKAELEESKEARERQHDAIVRQATANTQLQDQNEELETENKKLKRELDEWKEHAKNPRRAAAGRFRFR
jgi:hypothetical protein